MGFSYPAPTGPVFTGDTVTIDRFLKDTPSVAKRVATLASQKFISDFLLRVPLQTQNGSLIIEGDDEPLVVNDDPIIVTPLGDYPLTTVGSGTLSVARTDKWGHDSKISDESISRQKMNPVEKGMKALVTRIVFKLDGAAMSGIQTAIPAGNIKNASATITAATLEQFLGDVFKAKSFIDSIGHKGFNAQTAVLKPLDYGVLCAKLAAAGAIPESVRGDILEARSFPTIGGVTFLPSEYATSGEMLIADATVLGGILKENLASPGYARANVDGAPSDIETKSMRLDENDGWRIRARRVCNPVILEPTAAVRLQGVGTVTF